MLYLIANDSYLEALKLFLPFLIVLKELVCEDRNIEMAQTLNFDKEINIRL
jgi:hypothetical protein